MDFTIGTVDDLFAENDETFTVTLTLVGQPENVVVGSGGAKATATIRDDEELTVSVSTNGVSSVSERSAAEFTVNVTGGTSSANVVVKYEVSGGTPDGVEKEDYTAPSGTLTIPAGQPRATITIATTSDNVREPDESLKVKLTNAETAVGTVSVAQGDRCCQGAPHLLRSSTLLTGVNTVPVTVSVAGDQVTEGQTAEFTVTLLGKVSEDVTMTYMTADVSTLAEATATQPSDYTAETSGTLTIAAGKTTATISVPTGNDDVAEDEETFTVTLELPAEDDLPGRGGTRNAESRLGRSGTTSE